MTEPIRILLVDDEISFSKPMCERLTKKGFKVEVATSGPEALDKASALDGNFQVAIIDQVQGPPNGTEIMQRLHEHYPAIMVIILTGWGDMKPGLKALELGAYRYMSKTADLDEIELTIKMAARLNRERRSLKALVQAGPALSGVETKDELNDRIWEQARKLLPGLSDILVTEYDEPNQVIQFSFYHYHGERKPLPPRKVGNGITEYVLRHEEALLLPDGDEAFREEHRLDLHEHPNGNCTSAIVVPMFLGGKTIGTINAMTFDASIHYTQEHVELLQAFANHAAVAIQNVVQLEEARKLRDAAAALASQQGLDPTLETIVKQAHELIRSDFTGLVLVGEGGALRKIGPVIPSEYFEKFDEPRQDSALTRRVIETKRPVVIPDTESEPLAKPSVLEAGIHSMLIMPLIYGDQALGVLYAHTFKKTYYSQHEVSLWSSFAAQAAAALRRESEKQQEFEDSDRLRIALSSLTEKAALEETQQRIANVAKLLFQADSCTLDYVHPATGQINARVWAESDDPVDRVEDEPLEGSVTHHVIRTKMPVFRPDVRSDEKPTPMSALLDGDLKSFMSLPLLQGDRVIGVLHCNYLRHRQSFTQRHRSLFEAFGANAANALERGRRDKASGSWQWLDQFAADCVDVKQLYAEFTRRTREILQADFAIFYPYDLSYSSGHEQRLIIEDCVVVGQLKDAWQPPEGGIGGKFLDVIDDAPDGVVVVNDIKTVPSRFSSHLAEREGVQAFIALRLDAMPRGETKARRAGILILDFRCPTTFEKGELAGLRLAGTRIAATIQRLYMQSALQKHWEERNREWQATAEMFRILREGKELERILDLIAQVPTTNLGVDTCTILKYDAEQGLFTGRGAAGLNHPGLTFTIPSNFKTQFLDAPDVLVIKEIMNDERMRTSNFMLRERIRSVIICPLRADNVPVGLLFANYRTLKEFAPDEIQALRFFADFLAMIVHQVLLQEKLGQTQRRLERHMFLIWVSMIENSWRHSIVGKASSILNRIALVRRLLPQSKVASDATNILEESISDIEYLARGIADAPPRVPQSWEMEAEVFPLAPLLMEVANQKGRLSALQDHPKVEIKVELRDLQGIEVMGYRRWLMYAFEALLQNSINAMSQGGQVTLSGNRIEDWAELRIQDTGAGVAENIRGMLFKDLIPKATDKSGMGIGDLLVATIIEEHEGSVKLEKPGPGDTTVLVRLPVATGR